MDQHTWVRQCLSHYDEHGLTPEPGWQRAHYPVPECAGGQNTVWLTWEHHQTQGLLQSEEYGRMCFYNRDVIRFLVNGPLLPGWFDLWDLYDKWRGDNVRRRSKGDPESQARYGKMAHDKNPDLAKNNRALVDLKYPGMNKKWAEEAHKKHPKLAVENGSKGGKVSGSRSMASLNSQRWVSTDPNWPPFESNLGGLTKWQKARGIDTAMRKRVDSLLKSEPGIIST